MTTHWGDSGDERQFVTRLVAGALLGSARVTVLHLTDQDGRSRTLRDGGFEVRRLRATAPRPLSQAVLLASLRGNGAATPLPRVAGPDLLALEGGGSGQILSALAESEPDVVLICGTPPCWPATWPAQSAERPRTAIWPMTGEDALLELPGYRDLLEQADVICTVAGGEHRRLSSELGGTPRSPAVESLEVPVPVDRVTAGHRLPGLTRLSGYVVFLRGFPPGTTEGPDPPKYSRLRRLVPGLSVAEVSHREWRIHRRGSEQIIPYPASRTNLWRLMSHALATVDLRSAHVIGREVIESMLLGIPVAVSATSRLRETVEDSGGGVAFSSEAELVAALALFLDPREQTRLGEQGRRWAEQHHSDQERFAAAVREAVLGAG